MPARSAQSPSPTPPTRLPPTNGTRPSRNLNLNPNTSTTTLESAPNAIHNPSTYLAFDPRPSTDTNHTRETRDTEDSYITTSTGAFSFNTLGSRFSTFIGGPAGTGVVHVNPLVLGERRDGASTSTGRMANGKLTANEHRLAVQQIAQLGLEPPPPGSDGRSLGASESRGRELELELQLDDEDPFTARHRRTLGACDSRGMDFDALHGTRMNGDRRNGRTVAIPSGLAARAANGDVVAEEGGAMEYEQTVLIEAAMSDSLPSDATETETDDSASDHTETGETINGNGHGVHAGDAAVGPTLGEAGSEEFKAELKRLFDTEVIGREFASSEEWIGAVERLVSGELRVLEGGGSASVSESASASSSFVSLEQEDERGEELAEEAEVEVEVVTVA